MGNKWMADPAADRQLEIQVSRAGLPSTVKLKGLWFPEMRVISQLCLKMCQQPARWTQPASFLGPPQTIYIHLPPSEMQESVFFFLEMVSKAKTRNMCLITKTNEPSTSASKPLTRVILLFFSPLRPTPLPSLLV